jgi:hypothetical protein
MAEAKNETMMVRVEASEREAFDRAAAAVGMSRSVWVRDRLREAAKREGGEAQAGRRVMEAQSAGVAPVRPTPAIPAKTRPHPRRSTGKQGPAGQRCNECTCRGGVMGKDCMKYICGCHVLEAAGGET